MSITKKAESVPKGLYPAQENRLLFMVTLFEKLDSIVPNYSETIYRKFMDAIDGKCHNPFQYKSVIFALETEHSKAVQKVQTEQSGELLLRIASDEKGVYLEPSQIPTSMPSATGAV